MTELPELLAIANRAADVARDLFATTRPGRLTEKTDRDYATELDYAVERTVREFLTDRTPDIDFLGEEEGGVDPKDGRTYWALDPVDGTANLIHGLPLCGVSLGLIHAGEPILGVIDLPWLDERFTAAKGYGSRLNHDPIHASKTGELSGAIVSLGDFAVGPNAKQRNETRFALLQRLVPRVERIRMLGSAAMDLAWVAAGRLDASVILANKPWDVAAGVIIAREAGALVMDLDGSHHSTAASATVSAAPNLQHVLMQALISRK